WYCHDFNPKAINNRIDFMSLDAFVEHVALVNKSQSALNAIFEQPLLTRRPTLDPAIGFLRKAHEQIMRDVPRRSVHWNAPGSSRQPDLDISSTPTGKEPGRNHSCPCGSGKKYKHCHGRLISDSP